MNTLRTLKNKGCLCLNLSTDDPWNPAAHARWFVDTLPLYDVIFTPRKSTIADLKACGCGCVLYLPFGYDPQLFFPEKSQVPNPELQGIDMLFVGGADNDRVPFVRELLMGGLRLALYGGYWDRYGATKKHSLGQATPEMIRRATSIAPINLCLVRRANRDGHVMRSFEIPAMGGFMLAEDTQDHRDLFGPEEQCVLYFASPGEALDKARWVLSNPAERRRMATTAHELIVGSRNTYADRLEQMLTAMVAKG
jgi:spore maturation protein CgeB